MVCNIYTSAVVNNIRFSCVRHCGLKCWADSASVLHEHGVSAFSKLKSLRSDHCQQLDFDLLAITINLTFTPRKRRVKKCTSVVCAYNLELRTSHGGKNALCLHHSQLTIQHDNTWQYYIVFVGGAVHTLFHPVAQEKPSEVFKRTTFCIRNYSGETYQRTKFCWDRLAGDAATQC